MKSIKSRRLEFVFICSLFILCAHQSASAQTRSPASQATPPLKLQLEPCRIPKLDESARCGKYEVFEDRTAKTGRKIALNVMVLPATAPKAAPDPVFFIAGGPGQSAVGLATAAGNNFMAEVRRGRDIVLVDQRGTGGSHPLNCVLNNGASDLRSYFWEELFPAERLRVCRAELEKDANLALYSTPIAMDDLDEVRAALGYERINVYGGSYGSNAAFVYLRQHPDRVRSVVVSGVAPVDYKFTLAWAKGVQHAMDRLFDDCAADESCHKSFPKLREDFAAVLVRLDKGPVSFELPNPATRQTQTVRLSRASFNEHLRALLYSPAFARLLPLLIHAAAQGEFQLFGGELLEYAQTLRGPANQLALGMHLSVVCAEHIPFISEADIARETAGSFYGDARVRAQIKACEGWPRGSVSAGFIEPVKSDAPVLLISGDLDPVAPPWLAAAAAQYLPNSRHVIARNASHFSGSDCVDGLIAKFIAQGSARGLDASCVEQIKRPPFLTEEMARKLAGEGPKLDATRGLEEWNGILDATSAKLRLVLRVAKDADGVWSGELISVDQNNITLPIEAIKYQNAMMSFEVRVVGGSFEGEVKSGGAEITGQWKQGGRAMPLVFKRADKPSSSASR